jgi:hypothetical protein
LKDKFDERSVLIITSSPRSGSTLLSNVLKAIPQSCALFEPLHINNVPEAKFAGFSWRTYVEPDTDWPDGKAFMQKIFTAKVINEWTARELRITEAIKAKILIVKFVRANRLLPWISKNFVSHKPILLIRHPCAVIASQLKSKDWENIEKPPLPDYIRKFPAFIKNYQYAETKEEFLALLWAFDQLPALMFDDLSRWTIITYEELISAPQDTVKKICDDWGIEPSSEIIMSEIINPSSTVSLSGISGMEGWKNQLNQVQISRILNLTHNFGLQFYSENTMPDFDILANPELPNQIKNMGLRVE